MLAHATYPGYGMATPFADDTSMLLDARPSAAAGVSASHSFGELVALYQSNEHLLLELKSIGQKLTASRAALAAAGPHSLLAQAHFDRLRAKHSAALILLRANRIQARALLVRLETGTNPKLI